MDDRTLMISSFGGALARHRCSGNTYFANTLLTASSRLVACVAYGLLSLCGMNTANGTVSPAKADAGEVLLPADDEFDPRLLPTLHPSRWLAATADLTSADPERSDVAAVMDYLDGTTALQFARTFQPTVSARANGLGPGWRHSYDVVLTAQGEHRTIHDSKGDRHLFRQAPGNQPGVYLGENHADGRLTETASGHEWALPDGWRYRFYGSHLVSVSHDFQPHQLSLYYTQGRLAQVTDERGNQLTFTYEGRQLHNVTTPISTLHFKQGLDGSLDGASVDQEAMTSYDYRDAKGIANARRLAGVCASENVPDKIPVENPADESTEDSTGIGPILEDDDSQNTQPEDTQHEAEEFQACDTESSPPPAGFLTPSLDPLVIRVDARPETCQSYFSDYEGIDRGQAIENGFEGHERYENLEASVHSFPIVDFISDDELLIVISRDLTSASYNNPTNPDALYNTLMRDGQAIQNQLLNPLQEQGFLETTENGQTTRLTLDEAGNPVLELVIQYGMATPGQRDQIRRAAEDLAALHGIELRVIEIP